MSQGFSRRDAHNERFVADVYWVMLGQEPDAGQGYWVSLLDGGQSRPEMLRTFVNTAEYRQRCYRFGILSMHT